MRAAKATDVKRSRNLFVAKKSMKSLVGAERIELSTKGLRVRLPTHRRQAQHRGPRKLTTPHGVTKTPESRELYALIEQAKRDLTALITRSARALAAAKARRK